METKLQTEFWLFVSYRTDIYSPVAPLTQTEDYFNQVNFFFSDYVKRVQQVRMFRFYVVYQCTQIL